jgi:uncharacterized membrane protein
LRPDIELWSRSADSIAKRGKEPTAGSLLVRGIMIDHKRPGLIPLALLAAASGARSMTGVAALSTHAPLKLLAAGELIADKAPGIPNRVDPAPLFARVVAGALLGIAVSRRRAARGNQIDLAVIGGLVAFLSAHATFRMRRALSAHLPAVSAALVEDAIVVGTAVTGAALLRSER